MYIVALLLLIISGILGAILWLTMQRSEKAKAESTLRIRELTEKNRELSRYEGILEVDREVEDRRRDITQAQENASTEIQRLREEAELDVQQRRREAADLVRETKELQANTLRSASQQASRIVAEANVRANEVAGDAMIALREAKQLEATAKAMKNIIKGYGDEYLVPNRSLIDDLAEDFSHKEAGLELKTAREHSRQMVKSGLAAACDYAEALRKETAVHFILDAFNGKVDTILSRAKHDNFGKLDQEVRDAFSLVNHNGEAFRNARIQPQYLEARRSELRWTVAANELRNQEQEEQRQIKEQMREEERARKEYEKAIKEAEKEEKLLQQAMEQAKQDIQSASEEQRAEYQRRLEELEQKLKAAEEKNQRAISMAQQTKQGHVYIISNVGSFGDDVFKIGLTRRLEPSDRVRELGDASVPFEFDIHAMMFSEDAPALESRLHNLFRDNQVNLVNPRKEFFRTRITDIKNVVDEMGISVKWTMVAEAVEYRETLAVQKSQGRESVVREVGSPVAQVSEQPMPASRATTPTEVPAARPTEPVPAGAHTMPINQRAQEHDGRVEKASPQQPAPDHANEKTVPCPSCKGPLVISTLQAGNNTCPHCKKSFNVRRK
jgi:hypothetical protein